jgi:hypothetical protein
MHLGGNHPADGEPASDRNRSFPARVAPLRHRDNDVQIFVALQQKLH